MILRIGIPSYNGVLCEETQRTLAAIKEEKKLWTIDLRVASGTYPAHARNACITLDECHLKKQKYNFDYFLSMDADISFDVKNLERLIAANVDIISMAYTGRKEKTCNLLMAGDWGIKPGISSMSCWLPVWSHDLKKCDWAGMGACLIKKEVLENMEHPYFRHTVIDNGESANEVTEDWGFCIAAKNAGYDIWIDCDNRAAHIPH